MRIWLSMVCVVVMFTASGCAWRQSAELETTVPQLPFQWISGCWLSDDGSIEERWNHSMGQAHLFGQSVTRKDGRTVFFEHLRIDLEGSVPVLQAYPRGIGPITYTASVQGERSVTFSNASNDYPQQIRYWRQGNALKAAIGQLDGSKEIEFTYSLCPTFLLP